MGNDDRLQDSNADRIFVYLSLLETNIVLSFLYLLRYVLDVNSSAPFVY